VTLNPDFKVTGLVYRRPRCIVRAADARSVLVLNTDVNEYRTAYDTTNTYCRYHLALVSLPALFSPILLRFPHHLNGTEWPLMSWCAVKKLLTRASGYSITSHKYEITKFPIFIIQLTVHVCVLCLDWHHMITPHSCMCTHVYTAVFRTRSDDDSASINCDMTIFCRQLTTFNKFNYCKVVRSPTLQFVCFYNKF